MQNTKARIRWWRVAIWAVGGLLIGALSARLWMSVFVGIVFAAARFIGELSRPKPPAPKSKPLSQTMASHYQEAGLSGDDVKVFRDTMDQASDQIRQIEDIANKQPKLKAIIGSTDLVDVLHAYFKAIVQNPKQMGAAGHFLYEQLPNLLRIMQKYDTIDHHEVKTPDTYDVLTSAANTVSDLANAIRAGYAAFVEVDIDNLEADLALAKKQMPEKLSEASTTITHKVPILNPEAEKEQSHE